MENFFETQCSIAQHTGPIATHVVAMSLVGWSCG